MELKEVKNQVSYGSNRKVLNDNFATLAQSVANFPVFGHCDFEHAGANLAMTANVEAQILVDGLGPLTITDFWPSDNSLPIYDPTNNRFDLSRSVVGDVFTVRFDALVTTNSANQTFSVYQKFNEGYPDAFTLAFFDATFKSAGTYRVTGELSFFIRDENTRLGFMTFYAKSDGAATLDPAGYFIQIKRKANIV